MGASATESVGGDDFLVGDKIAVSPQWPQVAGQSFYRSSLRSLFKKQQHRCSIPGQQR